MAIPTEVIMKMATLGFSEEQAKGVADMMAAVEAATAASYEAAIESSKEKGRERWRSWKARQASNAGKRLPTTANVSQQLARAVEDKTSNSEIEPPTENKKRAASALVGFDEWYALYPNKVQRGAAEKAWPKALALAGSLDALVAGLNRYIASKPPDRPWQNPSTWLNGKGWLDQPAAVTPMARGSPRPPTAQEILRSRRESFNHDEPAPNGPYLIAAR